ncbi:MAG: lipoprotein [Steroidobacteraceae bacterium]
MRVLLIGVAAAVLTAGCGQKGALYLPAKRGTAVTPAPAATQPASGTAQPGTATQKKNGQDESTQQQPQPQPPQ